MWTRAERCFSVDLCIYSLGLCRWKCWPFMWRCGIRLPVNRSFEQVGRGFSCYSRASLDVGSLDYAESWERFIVCVISSSEKDPLAHCANWRRWRLSIFWLKWQIFLDTYLRVKTLTKKGLAEVNMQLPHLFYTHSWLHAAITVKVRMHCT